MTQTGAVIMRSPETGSMIVTPPALLLDGTRTDAAELGGKGAALARLVRWGLPVPATAAVTAGATRLLVEHPTVQPLIAALRAGRAVTDDDIDRVFLAVPLPDGLDDAIAEIARTIGGDHHVAVRSSATVEDLAHSSFAGQYRSFLDVDPRDQAAVLRAVRLVVASLWHPAPTAYRRAMGVPDADIGMCVLIMQMVPARMAGVVFTVAPGDPSATRVEYVRGLADDLVAGRTTPEDRTISREHLRTDRAAHDGEARHDVPRTAASLALEVEERAGCPQDVEWAWDGSHLWLVQARPITTLASAEDEFDTPRALLEELDLTTVSVGESLPGVLAPLLWDINRHLVDEAFRTLFDRLGALDEDGRSPATFVWRVNGRAAMDFARVVALSAVLPDASATELESQFFGTRRAAVERSGPPHRRWARSIVHDIRVASIRNRAVVDADVVCRVAAMLDAHDDRTEIEAASDDAIVSRHRHLLDLATRAMAAELGVAAHAISAFARLEHLLGRRCAPADAPRLAGCITSAASVAVRPSPAASAAVFGGPTWTEGAVQPARADVEHVAFDRVRARGAIRGALEREVPTAGSSLRRQLWVRSVRRGALEAAEQLHRREATKAAVLRLGGAARALHREMGARLVARGLLSCADDVELMTVRELHDAILAAMPPSIDVLRARRRHLRAHDNEPPLPTRFRGVPRPAPATDDSSDRVQGWAASPGRYTGVGRVVTAPADLFRDGDVLVAAGADPSWSPLLARAGAIVLERGGPLSHAAILARELGAPAVLNVPDATARFGNRMVHVDGDLGVVGLVDTIAPPEDGAP